MSWFKCKHPAASLGVESGNVTIEPSKQFPDEYQTVTYNLWCDRCHTPVKVGYSRLRPEIQAAEDAVHETLMARIAARRGQRSK